MKPYATVEDLEARWRPLSEDEKKKAAALIDDATAFLSSQIDSEIDDEMQAKLKAVCCAIVKRQMMPSPLSIDGQEMQPLTQFTQTGGPYSFSGSPANPTGDMYITQAEKRLLGIGVCVAFSVMPHIGGDVDDCR